MYWPKMGISSRNWINENDPLSGPFSFMLVIQGWKDELHTIDRALQLGPYFLCHRFQGGVVHPGH